MDGNDHARRTLIAACIGAFLTLVVLAFRDAPSRRSRPPSDDFSSL
jgi:hypothetical protein